MLGPAAPAPGPAAKIAKICQRYQGALADAMEACGQHVHEKAADELVGGKRHYLIARATFEPVVLPLRSLFEQLLVR